MMYCTKASTFEVTDAMRPEHHQTHPSSLPSSMAKLQRGRFNRRARHVSFATYLFELLPNRSLGLKAAPERPYAGKRVRRTMWYLWTGRERRGCSDVKRGEATSETCKAREMGVLKHTAPTEQLQLRRACILDFTGRLVVGCDIGRDDISPLFASRLGYCSYVFRSLHFGKRVARWSSDFVHVEIDSITSQQQ